MPFNPGISGLRVTTVTTAAAPAIALASTDVYEITALAEACAFAAPASAGYDFQPLLIVIKDNGVARVLSWNAAFVAIEITLPLITVAGKYMYLGCFYNLAAAAIHVVGLRTQA